MQFRAFLICLSIMGIASAHGLSPDAHRRKKSAEDIVIPSMEFKDTPLSDVLAFLERQASKLDEHQAKWSFEIKTDPSSEHGKFLAGVRLNGSWTFIPLNEAMKTVSYLAEMKFHFTPTGAVFAKASDNTALLPFYDVQDWQEEAVRVFPELARPGTPIHTAFLREHGRKKAESPEYFASPDWPMRLATAVGAKIPSAKMVPENRMLSQPGTIKLPHSPAPAGSKATVIAKVAFPSVVSLYLSDGTARGGRIGSGFCAGPAVIITNHHVVKGATTGYAKLVGEKRRLKFVRVLASSPKADIAFVEVEPLGAPALTPARDPLPAVGEEIFVVGCPKGLEGTLSNGIVSGIRRVDGVDLIQITAPISPGSSGGPVFNSSGEVIGVAVAQLAEGQNLNFAVPIKYVLEMVK